MAEVGKVKVDTNPKTNPDWFKHWDVVQLHETKFGCGKSHSTVEAYEKCIDRASKAERLKPQNIF